MRLIATLIALCASMPAEAETVIAAHTIRPKTILTPQDLVIKDIDVAGAASDPDALIGQEARVALYAGRPIRPGDVGPPAIVERNQIVPLLFHANNLMITAEGRSLDRAGVGEIVRVMNLSSRTTVMGRVRTDGRIIVAR